MKSADVAIRARRGERHAERVAPWEDGEHEPGVQVEGSIVGGRGAERERPVRWREESLDSTRRLDPECHGVRGERGPRYEGDRVPHMDRQVRGGKPPDRRRPLA